MKIPASDIAFTPAVKAIQSRAGSRKAYARMEEGPGWETTLSSEISEFISAQTSVFLSTVNGQGQPYIQHRGGPPGFLHVLDDKTIGFSEERGNRQFITQGNLSENPKAHLFLIDYARRRRVKIWGEARVIEDDPVLLERLTVDGQASRSGRAILFQVAAWDANCPQNIPQRFEAADVKRAIDERDRRIVELEEEIRKWKQAALQLPVAG